MSKRYVIARAVSQENNLQGLKLKTRELIGTFFLFKPYKYNKIGQQA